MIFLCHNSQEKHLVDEFRQDFGLDSDAPVFVDMLAIAPGQLWRERVEEGLRSCESAIVFLGVQGWGATHFEEAATLHAIASQRVGFVLIPAMFPGFRPEDGTRLGDGRFFAESCAVDLRDPRGSALRDLAIRRCSATLRDEPFELIGGREELSVYALRREALRFKDGDAEAPARFSRRRLRRARALQAAIGAMAQTPEIARFLTAVERRHRRQEYYLAVMLVAGIALLIGLLIESEQRRRSAVAQRLAAESRLAGNADLRLLLAAQAHAIDGSRRSAGAMLERLADYQYLAALRRFPASISALLASSDSELWVASRSGDVWRWRVGNAEPVLLPAHTAGAIAGLAQTADGHLWAALEDGRVSRYSEDDGWADAAGVTEIELRDSLVNHHRLGPPMQALAACDDWVAAGDHDGTVSLLRSAAVPILQWQKQLTSVVTALSFSADCSQVLAAERDGVTFRWQRRDGEEIDTFSTARTGPAMALRSGLGPLRILDQGGVLHLRTGTADEPIKFPADLMAAAQLGPSRETMSLQQQDRVLIGYADGSVRFNLDLTEPQQSLTKVSTHAVPVNAVALSPSAANAYSGASDGAVARYDLTAGASVFKRLGVPSGNDLALAFAESGPLVISAAEHAAWLQRYNGTGWISSEIAASSLDADANADGFVPIRESLLAAALDSSGAALWIDDRGKARLHRADGRIEVLAMKLDPNAGQTRAAVSLDRYVIAQDRKLWTDDGRVLDLPQPVRDLALGPRAVVVALEEGYLAILDSRRELRILASGLSALRAVVAYQAGAIVAGEGAFGTELRIVAPGRAPVTLQSRQITLSVAALAINEGTGWLAAGDLNGTLHLYDLESGLPIASVTLAKSIVHLAINASGTRLLLGSGDGDHWQLPLDPEFWTQAACRIAGRELTVADFAPFNAGVPNALCSSRQ